LRAVGADPVRASLQTSDATPLASGIMVAKPSRNHEWLRYACNRLTHPAHGFRGPQNRSEGVAFSRASAHLFRIGPASRRTS
jgi:hypothetical protein